MRGLASLLLLVLIEASSAFDDIVFTDETDPENYYKLALQLRTTNLAESMRLIQLSADGGFAEAQDLVHLGSYPWSVALGDVDKDGGLDLVFADNGAPNQLLLWSPNTRAQHSRPAPARVSHHLRTAQQTSSCSGPPTTRAQHS